MWKYSAYNSYPDIILHDCFIEKAFVKDESLFFYFDKYGFWINKNNEQNPYNEILRTDESSLEFTNINEDDVDITIFEDIRIFNRLIMKKIKNITLKDFISKLNSKEWNYEFVNEYYGDNTVMFCGYISSTKGGYSSYMQIEIIYDDMIYYWNKIYEDRVW